MKSPKQLLLKILLALFSLTIFATAESKEVLNLQIQETLKRFEHELPGARKFLNKSTGYLVIPNLYKAGFFLGGQYGEGGLLVKEPIKPNQPPRFHIAAYYSLFGASIGFQAGAQKHALIIVFLSHETLKSFMQNRKWKVGVDGSIAFVDVGGTLNLSTMNLKKPIVAFVFGNQGLMAGISLDGSLFTRIRK